VAEHLTGRKLGKYELHERLGSGGMAEVYKGYHATLARYVAVKILHPFLREDATFKERFEREAQNVARLRHPNIVQVYDFDQDPETGLYYMVMEYIDGPPLDKYLFDLEAEGQWIPLPEAIRIIKEIGGALSYAHSQDMVHRDLKPANVMIDSDGHAVLTDFGIARMVTGPQMTASGQMIGTPAYMSPEQGLGQHVDHRSDIYSLGIMLYQLATGALPYMADTPIAIVLQHVNHPLPPPSEIAPDVPRGLERILYKALAKLPEERYQSVDEMIVHLDDLESAETMSIPPSTISARAVSASASAVRPDIAAVSASRRRSSGLLFAIGGVVLAILAVVVGLLLVLSGVIPLGQIGSASLPTPTGTPIRETTPTPDQQATINALAATSAALAAAPVSPTPDLTATVIACAYDYDVVEQSPETSARQPDRTEFTQEITIVNNSWCRWGPSTRIVFVTGEQMGAHDFIEFDRILDPGDEYTIEIPFTTPDMAVSGADVQSTWRIELPDGTVVGEPIVIELTLYDSDILLTPAATDTPVATATAEVVDATPLVIDGTPRSVSNCRTIDSISYQCDVQIAIYGGVPPYYVTLGTDQYVFQPGEPIVLHLRSRHNPECNDFPWSVIVSDSVGTPGHQNFYFTVSNYYSAFVDGACP
jgi:serine/threonine protein kinase